MSENKPKIETEILDAPPPPPERPVAPGYLDTFLSPPPVDAPPAETIDDRILNALRQIHDPEIPVNIYDLGLIYDCSITDDHEVEVVMTLTTPHCPVAESMPGEVEYRLSLVEGVQSVHVSLVWDPPWSPDRMTEEAKLELGFI